MRRFDACVLQIAQVDKYQTVRFDHNAYSVPRRWAFRAVTVKGYVDRVEVVADGQVVARHARGYGRGEQVLDPLHYLVALGRKPAALDHAPVYRDWQLPPAFTDLRATWRAGTARGPAAGTTSACCNCSPATRWRGWSRRSCSCRGRGRRTPP